MDETKRRQQIIDSLGEFVHLAQSIAAPQSLWFRLREDRIGAGDLTLLCRCAHGTIEFTGDTIMYPVREVQRGMIAAAIADQAAYVAKTG